MQRFFWKAFKNSKIPCFVFFLKMFQQFKEFQQNKGNEFLQKFLQGFLKENPSKICSETLANNLSRIYSKKILNGLLYKFLQEFLLNQKIFQGFL